MFLAEMGGAKLPDGDDSSEDHKSESRDKVSPLPAIKPQNGFNRFANLEPFQLEKMQDALRNQLDNEEEYEDQDYMKNERGSTPRVTVTYIF